MLTDSQKETLKIELQKNDYDGMSSAEAHTFLFWPKTETEQTVTKTPLTPLTVAKVLGAAKAEIIATAVKSAYPNIADNLLINGLDPASMELQGFLQYLVTQNALTSEEVTDLLDAYLVTTTVTKTIPPLSATVFDSVAGFPNFVDFVDFDEVFLNKDN